MPSHLLSSNRAFILPTLQYFLILKHSLTFMTDMICTLILKEHIKILQFMIGNRLAPNEFIMLNSNKQIKSLMKTSMHDQGNA